MSNHPWIMLEGRKLSASTYAPPTSAQNLSESIRMGNERVAAEDGSRRLAIAIQRYIARHHPGMVL